MSSREDDEGFLSRWSRLKREPTRPAEPEPAAIADARADLPEGKSLEELVAALPNPLDLVPGQDLSAFMQAWVPADIRSAALRRMWLLDPAVRDYVNPALDYAYDYNIPGGAPGFGPMETTSEMVREVAQMFERAVGHEANAGPQVIGSGNIAEGDESGAGALAGEPGDRQDPVVSPVATASDSGAVAGLASDGDLDRDSKALAPTVREDDATFDTSRPMRPRRHGGALPS